jgi:ATP adenylyltransferase/5',5'''-P-1,P-4-tetraphosphate phosphorylase II
MIKGFGGVSGLLSVISTYFINLSKNKITEELVRLTGPSNEQRQEEARQTKQKANDELTKMAEGMPGSAEEHKILANNYKNISSI